jgi:ribosomal protein S18 acetylase RimI-like enzyme
MLYFALFVPAGAAPPDPSVIARPELARYVQGWGRRGDDGCIAVASSGDPIGAAWLRLWSADDRGYGFVDIRTPELTVAVRPEFRGRGIGTYLLQRLLECADDLYDAVSLSVAADNPAFRLYQRLGFKTVSVGGVSMTMRRMRSAATRRVHE